MCLEQARRILSSADFSRGLELLTHEQLCAYVFLEWLYEDGELTYLELWAMCPNNPLPRD